MIGAAALITTETFNNNGAGIYPAFDENNSVIGTQLIFGTQSGKKKKRIF
jgi:hypothetical protein